MEEYESTNIHSSKLKIDKCLIDMGAAPDLFGESDLLSSWSWHVKRCNLLDPRIATKKATWSEKVSHLHLQIRDLHLQVWFCVVDEIAADLFLGALLPERDISWVSSPRSYARNIVIMNRRNYNVDTKNSKPHDTSRSQIWSKMHMWFAPQLSCC